MTQLMKYLIIFMMLIINGLSKSNTVKTIATGFNGMGDLLVTENGDIYVANYGNFTNNPIGSTIVKITPDGQVNQFASGFQGASGITLDNDGNFIQASYGGSFISKVTPSGTVSTLVSQGLNGPVGVAVNSDNEIFVANCNINNIAKIENGVAVIFSTSSLFQCPNGMTIDDENNLYVVNYNNGSVIKIDPQGTASLLGNSGGGNGHIVYKNGKLYFANHIYNQVFEMALDGELKLLAGTGDMGHLDGDALNATFSMLNGIGISHDGNTVYVNESVALGPSASTVLNPNTLRAIELENPNNNTFTINSGLAGSWFNPNLDGQGVVFDFAVDDNRFDAIMFWFTYNNLPPDPVTELTGFGSRQNRWFTGIGPVNGSTIEMPIYRSSSGVFNDPAPVDTVAVGISTVEFFSCFEAILNFEFFEPESTSGSITLQRITPDINCESLNLNR